MADSMKPWPPRLLIRNTKKFNWNGMENTCHCYHYYASVSLKLCMCSTILAFYGHSLDTFILLPKLHGHKGNKKKKINEADIQ